MDNVINQAELSELMSNGWSYRTGSSGGSADKPKYIKGFLGVSDWVHKYGAVYKQTFNSNHITDGVKIDISLSQSDLSELLKEEISLTVVNENGQAAVYAIGGIPSNSFMIRLLLTEVEVIA